LINDLFWLWKVSREVCNEDSSHTHSIRTAYHFLRVQKNRFAFMAKSVYFFNSLKPFIHAKEGSPIHRLITHRPETVGAVVWPYQCNSWDAKERLKKIEEHYGIIENDCPTLEFHVDGALKLVNLGDIYENLHVVIDRPKWFMREGQLVINLFLSNVRIFSLAFSFAPRSGKVVAYVGALQGRNIDGMLDTYKDITRAMYGMRPRDLLFESFRSFCRAVGVSIIFAVSESHRHHRSSYFSKTDYFSKSTLNYDRAWFERGGILESPDFFMLGVEPHSKSMEDIPSHKRSMYRQRYKLLEVIDTRIQHAYAHLGEIHFLEYPFHSL